MNTLTSDWVANFLLGGAFVVLVSGARLAGHGADRSFTTLSRYLVGTLYYSSGKLALFVLLFCGTWSLNSVVHESMLDYLTQNPAWLALLSVAVIVHLPFFSTMDRAFVVNLSCWDARGVRR